MDHELLTSGCWSCWEGCCCGFDAGHEGLHRCPSPGCGDEWTTVQADAWWAEMKVDVTAYNATGVPPDTWT